MKRFILTTASAALLAGASVVPAMAATAEDLNSMTCADFRQLTQAEQMEVAAMAVAELNGGGESMLDTARAADPETEETSEAEADAAQDSTVVENEGTATATDGTADVEEESVMEADMEALIRACDRNLDAEVMEAAAGMDTQR